MQEGVHLRQGWRPGSTPRRSRGRGRAFSRLRAATGRVIVLVGSSATGALLDLGLPAAVPWLVPAVLPVLAVALLPHRPERAETATAAV